MAVPEDEDRQLRSVALQNATAILQARHRAERELHAERERLRITLASIGDAVISTDAEGRVTFLNGVAEALTGWPQAEAAGRPLPDIFHIVNEQTRAPVEDPARRALGEGRVVGLANHTILIARDLTERPIDDSAAPMRDEAGAIVGAVVVFRDVTERKQAERAQAERGRLAALRADVAMTLAGEGSMRDVLQRSAEAVVRHLDAAFARVWTLDEAAGVLELEASAGLYTHRDGSHRRVPVGEYKIGRIAQRRRAHVTNTVPDDPDVSDPAWARREGMVAFAGYPLVVDGRVVGVLALFARHALSDTVLTDLAPLADGVAQFIERKRGEAALRASEGRHRFLAELAAATQPLTDPAEVMAAAARLLAEHLNADRCAYAEVEDESVYVITGDHSRGVPSIVGRWPVDAFGSEHHRLMRANAPYVVTDADADPRIAPADRPAFQATAIQAVICIPLHKGGRFTAAMAVHQQVPRHWTPDELELVRTVAGRCWEALERARTTRRLQESEAQFRQLAETIPQLAWTARPDGHIHWYNRRWYEYTGTTSEEMEGWGWQKVHDPDVLPKVLDRWKGSIASGEPFDMVFPIRGADGVFRPFLTRVNALRDDAGRVTAWFGTNTDVSAQQRAEEAVRDEYRLVETLNGIGIRLAAELDLDRLLQAVTDETTALTGAEFGAFFYNAVDERGEVYNLFTLSGVPRAAFEGFPMPRNTAIFGPTFEGRGAVRLADVTADPRYGHNKPYRGMPEGHLPVRSYLAVPVKSRSGEVIGGLFFGHPEVGVFTERHERLVEGVAAQAAVAIDNARLYEQLREQDRKKDDFIALLAHELRNPLAPVRTGLQVMRLAAGDPTAVAQARAVMERQLGHMVRLIDDLMDVSRLNRDKLYLQKGRVLLAEVVSNAVETAGPAIEAAGHRLHVSLPPGPVPLDADLTRLAQVFGNLLTNAAKYTDRGGRIWLTAEVRDGAAVVSVRDTGIGIPADALPRIFDMFSQVDRSVERTTGGLGIGLALVKGLTEMHGGSVTAASAGPGRGSEFTVRLPVARPEPGPAATGPAGGARPTHGRGRRVLVVDDNRDGAETMAAMLELLGHEVHTAHDGTEAVEAAERIRPNLILMDVGMPKLNGLDATRQIRARPWGREVTVVALTGWGQDGDRERSKEAGCDAHLVKPVDPGELDRLLADLAVRDEQ